MRGSEGTRTPDFWCSDAARAGATADRVSLGLLAVLKLEWGERLAGRRWAAVSHRWVRLGRRRLGGLSRSRLRFVARPTLIDNGVQLDFRADRLSLVDRSALQLRPSRCDSHGQDRRDSSPRHESLRHGPECCRPLDALDEHVNAARFLRADHDVFVRA